MAGLYFFILNWFVYTTFLRILVVVGWVGV